MEGVADDLTAFRPNLPLMRTARMLTAGIAVLGAIAVAVVLAMGAAGSRAGSTLGYSLVFLLSGVLGSIYLWLFSTNTRLLVGRGQVGYQDFLGRRHLWAAHGIARVVDLTILYGRRSRSLAQRNLLLVGPDGHCLYALRLEQWSSDAVGAFIAATGKSPEIRSDSLLALEVRREFPGAVPWMVAHPNLTVWIFFAIVLVAIFLFLGRPSH